MLYFSGYPLGDVISALVCERLESLNLRMQQNNLFFFIMCKMTFSLNFRHFLCTILFLSISMLVVLWFFLVNKGRNTNREWAGSPHATCESIISGCSFDLNPWSVWNLLPNLSTKYRAEEYSKILLHYQQYFFPNWQQYSFPSLQFRQPEFKSSFFCLKCILYDLFHLSKLHLSHI